MPETLKRDLRSRGGCRHVREAQAQSYTPAYRHEAARLVIETDRRITHVAKEIGVGEQLLGRWVAVERARIVDPPTVLHADERAELEQLRTENAELRMDREFLKVPMVVPAAVTEAA
jgi:transposase